MITTLVLSPAADKIYFIDNFTAGNLFRTGNIIITAGGKGINVSRVLATLGVSVSALGFKAGKTGEWLVSELKDLGVNVDFIEVPGESRTNINIIDRLNQKETEILEIGPYISDRNREDFLNLFKKRLTATKVLICSGGLPDGIPADFYGTLIDCVKEAGIKVILDSSGKVLEEGIKAKPYLVKPNMRELSKFYGSELNGITEVYSACSKITDMGVGMVVASMGKEGALLVTRNKAIHAEGPAVEVINSIGSGDSMVAGLAAGILQDLPNEEMLKLGMACALANTQYKEIGYINIELVNKYLNEVKLHIL